MYVVVMVMVITAKQDAALNTIQCRAECSALQMPVEQHDMGKDPFFHEGLLQKSPCLCYVSCVVCHAPLLTLERQADQKQRTWLVRRRFSSLSVSA